MGRRGRERRRGSNRHLGQLDVLGLGHLGRQLCGQCLGDLLGVGDALHGRRARLGRLDHLGVELLVAIRHPGSGEPLDDTLADLAAVETRQAIGEEGHRRSVIAEEAVDALADDLGQRADAPGENRCPAGERLDAHQPERLRPRAGHQRPVALREQLVALRGLELTEVLDRMTGTLECRAEHILVVVALAREIAHFGRDPQPAARAERDVDRLRDALLGIDPADETERIAGLIEERRGIEGQAVVDDRPGHVGVGARLMATDRDHAVGRIPEQTIRPGQVEPAMERRDHGNGREARERDRPPLQVRVDDVELGTLLNDHLDRRREPATRVALDPGRSKRAVDCRDELARYVRVAAGEHRHVVPALDQLRGQLMHDSLRAAIRGRRDALDRRRDLRDPQAAHGGSHQLRPIPL